MDRNRRRRTAMAGGMAAATAGLIAGWAGPAHAGTVAPSAHAVCVVNNGEPTFGTNRVSGGLADFEPNQPFRSLITMKGPRNGRTFNFVVDITTPTAADGTWSTPGGPENGVAYSGLPVTVGWIVYRDTNNNDHYDDGTDPTVYRGSGDVTACPQSVTLSPK